MITLDKPIAVGRTAEVYAWGEHQVLKLYRDWCPPRWVDFEAGLGLAGVSMFNTIIARPWTIIQFGRLMAEMHAAMHAIQSPSDLPDQRDRLKGAIERAQSLPDDLRRKTLGILETLPDGDRLCHGDFHPDNVLMTPRGPIIIDWMTATRGDPIGDVARTLLLMTVGEPPTSTLIRLLTRLLRGWMRSAYLKRYFELRPEGRERLDKWRVVAYAARLAEDIKGEP